MKKRILSLLLVFALLLTALPQITTEANAHEIVMTADEFIECLWTAYSRPNYYKNVFPYNLGYYDGNVIYFDCWNLGKAIIWSKGEIVHNYTVGAYASMDTSCGLGDWDGLTIVREAPNCSSDFTNLVPGEWLYMDNHTGYYVGDGQVIECTVGWNAWGITVSQIDSTGARSRNGVPNGSWKLHGMVPWLDYTNAGKEETWIEKACFDVMVYRDRNKDLAGMTDAELKAHWLESGIKEGRASSTILDLGFYLNNNSDLQKAFGNDYEKVYNHFITRGYKEHRKSSALFDGSYYCENYLDVAASFKDEYLRHYVENGMAEGRRASLTFDPDYYWHILPDVYEAWPGDYAMCARHYAGHGINAQIEAYDHEHPAVTDISISDITEDGYTVSCKVTDNWGIRKVAFPTWTLLNNQDDLAADFMNTQLGTRVGDTFTFRVKASNHNYETGQYVTHIYAIDKGGNTTHMVLDVVEVKDPGPDKITLVSSSSYTIDEGILGNVAANTSVQILLSQLENQDLKVLDKEGNEIANDDLVGTGATINLYDRSTLVDSVAVVILGDVDGNGCVNATDYARIRSAFEGGFSLDALEAIAADVDQNGVIDTTDYLRIKAYFLDIYNLYEKSNSSIL
jgi:hypothetical protein